MYIGLPSFLVIKSINGEFKQITLFYFLWNYYNCYPFIFILIINYKIIINISSLTVVDVNLFFMSSSILCKVYPL